ncbi:MAG: cytochrome P450 [Pseudomonadota bacterium]
MQVSFPIIGKVWLTTTHNATAALLKDNKRFTVRKTDADTVAGMRWWMPQTIRLLADNMLTTDDPEHRRLRKLVDQAFARRAMVGLQGRITEICEELLPDLGAETDVLNGYCREVPLRVIADLLGIDRDRREVFSVLTAPLSQMSGPLSILRLIRPFGPLGKLVHFVREEIKAAKEQPDCDGLISALVAAEADGDRLSGRELVAMIFLLLVAGHETTTHMLAGSIIALARNPEPAAMLRKDESLDAMATEELLRFVSAVQFSKPRYVQRAGSFYGADLAKGDFIMAGLAAANHDPGQFDDPSRLDVTRKPNQHLEFGTGIHFCLGFQLARLEIASAVRVLLEKRGVPVLGEVSYAGRLGMRAVSRLTLR